jgi:hypothetical protein
MDHLLLCLGAKLQIGLLPQRSETVGIRETLNQNPAITTGATIAIIIIALIFIVLQFVDSGPDIPTKSWYTTDDSSPEGALASLFKDDINKIPPFEKDGKQAYRAQVYTCDRGKTRFVAYIERYTPEAKQTLERLRAAGPDQQPEPGAPGGPEMVLMTGIEYKKPGGSEWIKQTDFQKIQDIMTVKCPDGSTNNLEPVRAD